MADDSTLACSARTNTAQPPPLFPTPSSRGEVILVVDDTPEIRHLVAEILQEAGYVVLTAASGRDALATLAKQAVALVLLDVMMPGLDGITTLTLIRQQFTVPVIILSALDRGNLHPKRNPLEIDAYLPKPFSFQHLLDTVQLVLQGRSLARQLVD